MFGERQRTLVFSMTLVPGTEQIVSDVVFSVFALAES